MDIEITLKTLQSLLDQRDNWSQFSEEQRNQLMRLTGLISRPDRLEKKLRRKAVQQFEKKNQRQSDQDARRTTGIRRAREHKVFSAPKQLNGPTESSHAKLSSARNCYVCKVEFTELHHFYDSLCPNCAELNYRKRFQTADLNGRVALITGSRLKIGYQATLMLLRAGAEVIATTRFPIDSAQRFSCEEDFERWQSRLHVYGLDLRHSPSVEIFCHHLRSQFRQLDFLINNAAQTVRRPPGFYAHLLPTERMEFAELPSPAQNLLRNYQSCRKTLVAPTKNDRDSSLTTNWQNKNPSIGLTDSAQLAMIPYSFDHQLDVKTVFPEGQLDVDLQQVDLRRTNSWRMKLGEVPAAEMLEVQLINSIAPFILSNELLPLMRENPSPDRHIVNVTAMEGKFYRFKKESRHPHTNMAKAALNMLTHTSAGDLAKEGIFVNAVDTGWVTDEDPAHLVQFKQSVHDFQPPLDIVDGAARVCDPIFDGINRGEHWSGQFLKDYFPIDW